MSERQQPQSDSISNSLSNEALSSEEYIRSLGVNGEELVDDTRKAHYLAIRTDGTESEAALNRFALKQVKKAIEDGYPNTPAGVARDLGYYPEEGINPSQIGKFQRDAGRKIFEQARNNVFGGHSATAEGLSNEARVWEEYASKFNGYAEDEYKEILEIEETINKTLVDEPVDNNADSEREAYIDRQTGLAKEQVEIKRLAARFALEIAERHISPHYYVEEVLEKAQIDDPKEKELHEQAVDYFRRRLNDIGSLDHIVTARKFAEDLTTQVESTSKARKYTGEEYDKI